MRGTLWYTPSTACWFLVQLESEYDTAAEVVFLLLVLIVIPLAFVAWVPVGEDCSSLATVKQQDRILLTKNSHRSKLLIQHQQWVSVELAEE